MTKFFSDKKSWLFIITGFVLFVQFFGLLLIPQPAKALPSEVTVDAPAEVKEVKKTIGATILSTAMGGLMNAFSYFMRKLAYDSAMYLASGGKGQGALAFKDGFGSYIQNVALDSVATMVDEMGKPFGLNLCQTPDLNFQVYLQISLRNMYVNMEGGQGPQPSCTFQQLKDSWSADAFAEKYGSVEGMMERTFNNAIRVENSDFGIAYGAMAQVDRNKARKEEGSKNQRLEGGGFKAATGLIDNKIKTPSRVVEEETMSVTNKGQSTMTAGQVAGVYGSGMLQVIPQALSVFLNTFISQGLKTVMGMLTGDDSGGGGDVDSDAGVVSFDSAAIVSNRQKAHAAFSQLLTVKLNSAQNYSILEEMTLCPSLDDPNVIMWPDHCVIDTDFKMALDRARMGSPLTIEQAVKENLLHGDWILVSPKRVADNTSPNCAQGKYCYSNIQKLRRNRVLPLGFEIAASYADPDEPGKNGEWTLGKVMKGFDDCAYVLDKDGNKVIDPLTKQPKVVSDFEHYPYCHLIDPNWILKASTAQCNVMAYGSTLQDAQTGVRAQYCADLRTCLKEELGKACDANQYGYCTREKNVWRFAGDSCDKAYNTCTGYFSRNGELNYFLSRTLDYGECSMNSIGCRGYSANKTADGKWVPTFSAGINQAYYFSEKIIADSCGEADEGCSEFYLSESQNDKYQKNYTEDNRRFIKKAPDYLHCYDTDLDTPAIDWPKTKQDLMNLKPNKECSTFAQACLPEEVDCDLYTPQTASNKEPIPAKIGESQLCAQECVGYDALEQEATNFEYSVFPLYFIPTNGKTCSETHKGCDEFTNIDELAKGGEGLEYFYNLKYCEKPTADNQAAYYSWEGSETEGYVLKIHKLRPYTEGDFKYISGLGMQINVAESFPVGSPAYNSDDKKFLEEENKYCDKDGYSKLLAGGTPGINGASNEDCRALYDKAGKVYYRLLADTVEVSDACHPLRKTKSTYWEDTSLKDNSADCAYKKGKFADNKCMRCLNGGFYEKEKDACVYWTTGVFGSCTKEMNGCRKYTGNQGNNVENVLNLSFEPEGNGADAVNNAKAGWSPVNNVAIAAESLQVGLHSLQIKSGIASYEISSGTMVKGALFTLSFWARGENIKLGVNLKQGEANAGSFTFDLAKSMMTTSSIGYDWREYHLGPVTFTGESSVTTTLEFQAVPAGKVYFLDNLLLSRLNDTYHLIKDSWKTAEGYQAPKTCDEIPEDPYPGKALGCRAYTQDSTGQTVYATGFTNLCREEAIGCRAVYDTYNTQEQKLTLYNVWCAVTSTPQNVKCVRSVKVGEIEEKQECVVPQNAQGCFIDKMVIPDGAGANVWSGWVVSSTIVIPADTPENSPIFLTVHKNFQCTEKSLGCQAFGLEEKILPTVVTSTDAYLLNNPAKYVGPNGTLCRSDLVGCEEFKAGNDIVYFKEPKLVGNTFCEHKTASQGSGISMSGWFQKDVGYCYVDGTKTDKLCKSSGNCGNDGICKDIGTAPCYQDYQLPGGEYGLWSNGSDKYKSMVGLCPAEANNCRELLDTMDRDKSDTNDLGRAYYVIYDQKLLAGLSECEGQVSWKKGCALFNKTDEPNLLYDANATYDASLGTSPPHSLVSPVSTKNNDSNTLLKVTRDRECGEWLACRGSMPIPDSQSQSGERYACYSLQPCRGGNNFYCSDEASPEEYGAGEILSYDKYIARDVSWFTGYEYDGYSLFGKYHPTGLSFVDLDKKDTQENTNKMVLGYVNKNKKFDCDDLTDGPRCGNGVCYDGQCIYATDGVFPKSLESGTSEQIKSGFAETLSGRRCRAYPAQDSPFTDSVKTIVQSWSNGRPVGRDSKYVNASICQEKEDCDCNYTKVGYGLAGAPSEYRYYGYSSSHEDLAKGGICQGGLKEGLPCVENKDCGDETSGATCLRKQALSRQLGWNGFCLEPDISRRINNRKDNEQGAFACLTWYPLDYVPNLFDVYYNDPGKGYIPPAPGAGDMYCAEASAMNDLVYSSFTPDTYSLSGVPADEWKQFISGTDDWFGYCVDMQMPNNATCSGSGESTVCSEISGDFICRKIKGLPNAAWNVDDWCRKLESENVWKNPMDCSGPEVNQFFAFDFNDYYNEYLLELLRKMPANINGDFDEGTYEYVSRVDTNLGSDSGGGGTFKFNVETDEDASDGNFFDKNDIYDEIKPVLLRAKLVMDKHNQDYKIHKWRPLLPAGGVTTVGEEFQGDGDGDDSGIVINYPTNYEKFLNKNNILSIKIIPIVPECEVGASTNCTNQWETPAFGYAHEIKIDGKYPAIGSGASQGEILFNRSTMGNTSNCPFCKWWVSKIENGSDYYFGENLEGYLFQWWQKDPVNGDEGWMEYTQANSYLVDPLEYDDNKQDEKVLCTNDRTRGNWIAIEFLFDKQTGQFKGYRSRNCANEDNDNHGYGVAISWKLRPMCLKTASVFDISKDTTNKAYTDRVWDGSEYKAFNTGAGRYYYLPQLPFGSGIGGTEVVSSTKPWLFSGGATESNNAGYPWACAGIQGFSGKCSYEMYLFNKENINIPSEAQIGFSPSGWNTDKWFATSTEGLHALFAKFFDVKEYDKVETGKPKWSSIADPGFSLDNAQVEGRPPYIYPAIDCVGETCSIDKSQPSDKPGFSINGVAGKDANEALFGVRNKSVIARFFTWADHNQMPLRRIMIDWQDQEKSTELGTVAGNTMGYYANYKPYCGDGGSVKECVKTGTSFGMTCNNTFECHPGGYTCKENGAHFGNQTGTTCVNRPAQRFFNYTCDADEYVDLYKDIDHFSAVDNDVPDYVYKVVEIDNMFGVTGWKTFLNKKTYKDDQLVCVFQPRVQVMDNWGWCTGSCNDENKGGCYNEFGLTKAVHCLEASMNAWVGYSNVVVVAL